MPPGQLDRLHAPLRPQRERPPAHQLRPVCQASDLQIGPAELARQGDAVLEVPVGLLEATGPQLGDAEVDQRQRPQVPAQPEARWVGGPGGSQQPLRLLGHGREVPALPGQPHAHDGEYHLRALTPVRGHRFQSPGGESQVPFGILQGSPGQLVPGHLRGQLRIRRDHAGREPGQELVRGGAEPVEPEADPVVRQQAGGRATGR